jgi:hypothetical protein
LMVKLVLERCKKMMKIRSVLTLRAKVNIETTTKL